MQKNRFFLSFPFLFVCTPKWLNGNHSNVLIYNCCSVYVSIIADYREHSINELTNDSSAAILQMVPMVYRKFLTMKPRNQTMMSYKNSSTNDAPSFATHTATVVEMLRNIARYNELQSVLNEDLFGPLQNDSVIIVVQVSKRLY